MSSSSIGGMTLMPSIAVAGIRQVVVSSQIAVSSTHRMSTQAMAISCSRWNQWMTPIPIFVTMMRMPLCMDFFTRRSIRCTTARTTAHTTTRTQMASVALLQLQRLVRFPWIKFRGQHHLVSHLRKTSIKRSFTCIQRSPRLLSSTILRSLTKLQSCIILHLCTTLMHQSTTVWSTESTS